MAETWLTSQVAKSDPNGPTPLVFRATPAFWKSLNGLNAKQSAAAEKAFLAFRADPFDPKFGTHAINKLSARYGRTIWSVTILGNLRAVFYVVGNVVVSVDIGTHDIYK
jgi:hypothetical protein